MREPQLKRGKKLYPLMCDVSERLANIRRSLELVADGEDRAPELRSMWLDCTIECERLMDLATQTFTRLLAPRDKRATDILEREMLSVITEVRSLLVSKMSFNSVIPDIVMPEIKKFSALMKKYAEA